jgi:hypothetical protein
MLLLCAAGSVALHSMLLLMQFTPPASPGALTASRDQGSAWPDLQLRLQTLAQTVDAGVAVASPAQAPAAEAEPVAAAAPQEEMAPGQDEREAFIPRPLLSVAPSATSEIVLEAPAGFNAERYFGILSLFIDELGRVRYIAADAPLLPPVLEQLARDAFMAAQFSPGQIDGQPVKSRQRVEVVFDGRPPSVH